MVTGDPPNMVYNIFCHIHFYTNEFVERIAVNECVKGKSVGSKITPEHGVFQEFKLYFAL
jgi:hypothetical protein